MKKALSLLLASAIILSCAFSLVSCKNADDVAMTMCIGAYPDTVDPALNSTVDGATYIVHIFSGLVGYETDASGKVSLAAQCAEELPKVKTLASGKTSYTFRLREDLKWSDGSQLTAEDFVYAWNRAADPVTNADYHYMFNVIDGYDDVRNMYAMEINNEGEEVFSKDSNGNYRYNSGRKSLNVTASSDGRELTVVLKSDVPYFFELCAFPAYMPVKKDVIEQNGNSWAVKPETYIGNGAYRVVEFSQSQLVLEKNEHWFNAESVENNRIAFAFNENHSEMLEKYKSGVYQFIDDVPNDEIEALKENSEFYVGGQLGTHYITFNVNDDALNGFTQAEKTDIRRALSLLIDRNHIADNIGKAGQIPASGFVAMGLTEPDGSEYISKNGIARDGKGYFSVDEADYSLNCKEALSVLESVAASSGKFTVEDNKISGFPVLTYITNEDSMHEAVAAYLQQVWGSYGITLQIETQEWATFLNTRKDGNYSVARNGWVADFNDPISFLDLWFSSSGHNDCQFGRGDHASYAAYSYNGDDNLVWAESYDKIIDDINTETDPEKRFELMHSAEDILMSTAAICPIFYYTDIYMCKSSVKGFFSVPLGFKFFMYASVKE